MLVTLQEASDHLRRDTGDDDNDLTLKIIGASAAIQNYLQNPMLAYEYAMDEWGNPVLDSSGDPFLATDSSGDFIVRHEVKIATLIMVGYLYKDRDADEYTKKAEDRIGKTYLPQAVHWLLDPLRKPVLA